MNATKLLIAFVDEQDRWGNEPLYQSLLDRFTEHELAGAVALPGIGAFGSGRIVEGIEGYARTHPIAVMAIDSEEKLREVLPEIRPMVAGSLMILTDVEMLASASPALVS